MSFPLDRSPVLTVHNPFYREQLQRFFDWQLGQDGEDLTGHFFQIEGTKAEAHIFARAAGVLSGREEVSFLFEEHHLQGEWHLEDGRKFESGSRIVTIRGDAATVLRLERVILNFLSRMSGITTTTARMVDKLPIGVSLAATRKTLWGLFDKKAVAVGGGLTHRLGLFDALLAKENHLALLRNGAKEAAEKIALRGKDDPESLGNFWEIEVETGKEFFDVLEVFKAFPPAIPGVIMLDNFSPEEIRLLLEESFSIKTPERNIFFEASGGINEENYLEFAETGVDVISSGSLTHTVRPIDLTLQIQK